MTKLSPDGLPTAAITERDVARMAGGRLPPSLPLNPSRELV